MKESSAKGKLKFIAIVGPTASGKSSLALWLAQDFGGEIISADSMQVYRGLDIGTAKPSPEERRRVFHHLVDILDPDQDYSAAIFRERADAILEDLHRKHISVFVVGGTGLYFKTLSRGLFRGPAANVELRLLLQKRAEAEGSESLHRELRQLDPEAALRIHPRDTLRIVRALEVLTLSGRPISCFQREHGFREEKYEVLKIGLTFPRAELYRRIEERMEHMLELGWVEEVRSLLSRGYRPVLKSLQSLGYKQIVSHLLREQTREEAIGRIARDTRRYAKRQLTWFKADPEIQWFCPGPESTLAIRQMVERFLE
ncbi:MAG: tRNA (adenosine(37)-N6)-dimethylallyltransferase MiaA [Deltaproteobacteria bacterium]|nr:tRNA (adenosine(37)-N6)-dimethylallyltransferase MiaA [Deltaproteobacteria bacterium]